MTEREAFAALHAKNARLVALLMLRATWRAATQALRWLRRRLGGRGAHA